MKEQHVRNNVLAFKQNSKLFWFFLTEARLGMVQLRENGLTKPTLVKYTSNKEFVLLFSLLTLPSPHAFKHKQGLTFLLIFLSCHQRQENS